MYHNISVDLYCSYLHAIAKPQGEIELNVSQDTDDRMRFPAEIFKDEIPVPLIYAPVCYETETIELSRPALS